MWKQTVTIITICISMFLAGCGSSNNSTTVSGITTVAFSSAELKGKALYMASTKGYAAFSAYSSALPSSGNADWESSENTNPAPSFDSSGTWSFSGATLSFTSNTVGVRPQSFTRIQSVSGTSPYWLVSDSSGNIKRVYYSPLASAATAQTAASAYLAKIQTAKGIAIGGAIQPATPLAAVTFSNVSSVKIYSAQVPPQISAVTTMDGMTFYVLDSKNNQIEVIKPDRASATLSLQDSSANHNPVTLNRPSDITTDGTYLYVTDTNNYIIRKIEIAADGITGICSTIAGTIGSRGSADGEGLSGARFAAPVGITSDGTNLYVTDNQAIRKIVFREQNGVISSSVYTLAGALGNKGYTDGIGNAARFNEPLRLTTDGSFIYVADYANFTVRKVSIGTGQVTTLAGSRGNSGNLDGIATAARFSGPNGITTDGHNLYVTDFYEYTDNKTHTYGGHTVRMIRISDGNVTLIAGTPNYIGHPAPTDPVAPLAARFYNPMGITTDGISLFVADSQNQAIRRIY